MTRVFMSYKKIATSILLIISIFFSHTHIASAQFGGLGGLIGGGGSLAGGLNIRGVGAVALQCATSNLNIGGGNNPFSGLFGNEEVTDAATDGALELMPGADVTNFDPAAATGAAAPATDAAPTDQLGLITGSVTNVPVADSELRNISNFIRKNTNVIKTEQKKETKKEECLDRIAQWAAITVLDRITFATLEWINSGFEGRPFYVENPQQFFTDLATKELLGFNATFTGDPSLYPFGQAIVRTVLLSFQRTAEQNLINSLNAVLAHGTIAEWQVDFSVGGWAGYTAFVEPNNNIIGAYIESSQMLQRRLEGTRISTAVNIQAELQQGLGFLSQRSCVQTQNGGEYIPENSIRHIRTGAAQITNINQIPTQTYQFLMSCDIPFDTDGDGENDSNGECIQTTALAIEIAENYRGRSICTEWRNLTPGHQIAQSATRAVGMSQDQLLLVDELNENLGLLLDAFMLQLINQGISAFDSRTNPNNVLAQQVRGENPGAASNTVSFIEAINGFSGGQANQFAGIIPLQEEYIEKATTLVDLQGQIIQRTFDLDYCVPGPNPAWQANSANAISTYFATIPAYESTPTNAWVQFSPEAFVSVAASSLGISDITLALNTIYSTILMSFTGLDFSPSDLDSPLVTRQNLIERLFGAFQQYADLINERYILADDFVGDVRSQSYEYYFNLGNVAQQRATYAASIEGVQDVLDELNALREEYADIERQYIIEQLQVAVNQQGITSLADNLQQFQSFSPSQVTYIGVNGQPSAYQNAVTALIAEFGQQNISPPQSYPGIGAIFEEFVALMPNTATQSYIDIVDEEIANALATVGNAGDPNSLLGLVYSCVQQVTQTGSFANVPFAGFNQRIPYPYPISQDIPGLILLPVTATFLEDVTILTEAEEGETGVVIPLSPDDEIDSPENLQIFESMFINIGQGLF